MTNEEAKVFLDNLKICIDEHPVVADWLVEISNRKNCRECFECSHYEPRECYLRKSCDHYGDKQVCGRCREYNLYSHTKTEQQIFTWGKEVHEYCKRNCGESKARMRDGDRFIVCGQANDEICISLRKCPLDKWVAGEDFHILPMDEPQTDCPWGKGADNEN